MNQPPTNICPLLAIANARGGPSACIEECCAFWNFGDGECVVHTIADAIREGSDQ